MARNGLYGKKQALTLLAGSCEVQLQRGIVLYLLQLCSIGRVGRRSFQALIRLLGIRAVRSILVLV